MKFEVTKERQEEGVRGVTEAFIKMNYNKKTISNLIFLILFLLACFGIMAWLDEELRKIAIVGIAIILITIPTIIVITKISLKKSKNQKMELNIEKVEHEYEDKITLVAYLKNGSIDKSEHAYSDVKKMVERENFIYLFLANNTAIVVDKLVINVEEFKQFIKGKNTNIEEIIL